MTKLEWAAAFGGVNLLVLFVLSLLVVGARNRHKVTLGDGGNPEVLRAIRAHGNAAEYIPAGMAGLVLMAALDSVPLIAVQAIGGTFTVARVFHAFGLSTSAGLSVGRAVGTLGTWLALLAMGGLLVYAGVKPLLG